ncbi:hypothetical protein QQ045_013738 [Rhodiola kirilowii]
MAEAIQLAESLESYVLSVSSPTVQAESLDVTVSMLKNDALTMEQLVVGMEKYLTSMDHVVRGRAIHLLADSLARLESKSLSSVAIHSLVAFFSDRLEDWKAVKGALVGCLALLRRKRHTGAVSISDATTIAQSFLQNLQVQSLGKHDRELCFQLLECLLVNHPEAAAEKGDDLVYGICEAADGEKDPKCLLLVFHIIEVLGQIFSDSSSPLETYAGDLFDILGCYFPIHFTHPKSDNIEVKRDDLSRQLMLAMSSTPFFEPYAVPLFLEKLSSSLLSAKVDSLKYLSDCALKYGSDRMKKHAESIWSSIKETTYNSQLEPTLSLTSELIDGNQPLENEVAREALLLLQNVVMQNDELFSSLLVNDADIGMIIDSNVNISSKVIHSLESMQKLHSVGCIMYVSAKASSVSCSRLLKTHFLRLIKATGISDRTASFCNLNGNVSHSQTLNVSALYLCVELLAACRDQAIDSSELTSKSATAYETCPSILESCSACLIEGLSATLLSNPEKVTQDIVYLGVKGLGILLTLPKDLSPVSNSFFEDILETLMTIFGTKYNHTLLWSQTTKELVFVGSYVSKLPNTERMLSFKSIVIDKMILLISLDNGSIPLQIKLDTVCEIGTRHLKYMLRIFQGLENVLSTNLSDAKGNGNMKPSEIRNQIMKIYTTKMLPCLGNAGDSDDIIYQFAINIWDHIDRGSYQSISGHKEILSTTMMAMKVAVAYCTVEKQSRILEKAYDVLSSSDRCILVAFKSCTNSSSMKDEPHAKDVSSRQCINEWLMSVFASVIMALRPQTSIPNERAVMRTFVISLLDGHVPSAQALGSMFNKLHMKTNEESLLVHCHVKELVSSLCNDPPSNVFEWSGGDKNDSSEDGLPYLSFKAEEGSPVSVHAIWGLAWMAKGLLMRGHEKANDIIEVLLSLLLCNEKLDELPVKTGLPDDGRSQNFLPLILETAADAFAVVMRDSNVCLNTRFHAVMRPLFKQRLLSTMTPVFLSAIRKCHSSFSRNMLYRAFAHVLTNAPLGAVLNDSRKLVPVLVECLSLLSKDALNKEIIHRLLVVLYTILTEESVAGQEIVKENANIIINCLIGLAAYPHMMFVRETSIQCLTALSRLPHTRVYPMKTQVLKVISNALDDPKRAVRLQAVKCREAWLE